MNELISIIIPVYNVEAYLERCISSVIMQTYRNLEIILVDDGSQDRCGDICEYFAQLDSRIRVYHKVNGGLSDARNYGVEHSRGRYITFVDSDDYIAPNYVEELFKILIKHDADISCCSAIKTTKNTVTYGCNTAYPTVQLFTGEEACRELLGNLYCTLVTAWGKLYKSDIVKKYPFPVGRKHEDEATTCKYYYSANRVVVSNQCLYVYFQHLNSIMHTGNDSINIDSIWTQEHRAEFFENHNEKKLARAAWDRLFYYCLYESKDNHGRYNCFLWTLAKRKKLSWRTWFEFILFTISPRVFDKYLKIIIYPLGRAKEKVKKIYKGTVHERKRKSGS